MAASHGEDNCSLDDSGENLVLNAWPGGESHPVCIDWMIRDQTTQDILQASSWQAAGQQLGILDDLMPAVSSGILVIKGEWDQIFREERNNK